MLIHIPVLLLLSEIPEVEDVLVGAFIVATLGRALGGLEDGSTSAALVTAFSSRKNKFDVKFRVLHSGNSN